MSSIFLRDIQNSEQLGSQMNNFAMLYCISKKTGHSLAIHTTNTHGRYPQTQILDVFDAPIKIDSGVSENITISSNYKDYKDYFNIREDDNYTFCGLFHHATFYWSKQIDEIRKNLFVFKSSVFRTAREKIASIQSAKKTVGVHFRRGDYCYCNAAISNDYYKNALKHFSKDFMFVVFSDDILYCKANKEEIFEDREVFFMEGNPSEIDLCCMSLCDHNIIANSTFSIWGAALNSSIYRRIVSPRYTPGGDSISDCFSDWIVLDIS